MRIAQPPNASSLSATHRTLPLSLQQMAGKDQGKEKPSKSRQSKWHLKRSIHKNPSSLKPSALSHTTTLSPRMSHDAPCLGISLVARRLRSSRAAPPPVTSHIPPPPKASRVAPAHNTSQVPLPPKSSRVALAHNTSQVAPPPKASHVAPPPNSSHVAPSSTSHAAPSVRTFHATPPSSTSRVAPSRTTHVTLSHVHLLLGHLLLPHHIGHLMLHVYLGHLLSHHPQQEG